MRSMALCVVLLLAGVAHAQEEKIFKKLTPEETDELLKKFDIDFKKVDSKTPGTYFYDFKRKNFEVRFYHFEGKDVMLDAVFPKASIERVNEWNIRAKFSRACLQRNPKGEYVTLESNLDLVGGVTEGAFKQFFLSFDEELKTFAVFLGESKADEVVFRPVTPEKLEAILKGMGIVAKKGMIKDGSGEAYEFEVEGLKMRLVNFGGKDLMIDAHFPKIALEDVNRYNLEKKFIRAVAYDVAGKQSTALECNLDCEAGTAAVILRTFVVGFVDDAKTFAKYVESKQ